MAKAHKKTKHPWVTIATICHDVLEEKNNVLSVIRIVDRFTFPRPPDWDGKTNLHMPLIGVAGFKSGDVRGHRTVKIYGTSPGGKRQKLLEVPVEFLGRDAGVNIRLNMLFGFKTEGTHWLDIYVENWHATRIPITIVFEPMKESHDEPPVRKE